MGNDLIKLKGTGDGVKVYLDENAEFSEITSCLRHKLDAFRHFFGNGHCNIYFLGRRLEKSDMLRLESVVSSMLPESSIYYGEKRTVKEQAKEPANIDRDEKNESEFDKIKDVVTTNFKSSRARFYEGVVKVGRTVESDGHLVLVGDVEKGAKVTAAGNIVIVGRLSGSAEAGCMGNKSAYVISMDFEPENIKIAGVKRSDFNVAENGMQKAVLTDNQIYTYKYREEFI